MNCPFKKTNKRALSVLLVMLMIISIFAGCKKDPAPTDPSTEAYVPSGLVEVKPTETTVPTSAPTEPIDENAAVINKDNTEVRQTPSTDANPIGKLNKGTQVTIIREVSVGGVGWTLIREGWVKTETLDKSYVPENPDETKPIQTPAQMENQQNGNAGNTGSNTASFKGTITADPELNIRKDANQNSTRVGSYKKGTQVTILETKNGWGRTDRGWISLQYVNQGGTNTNTNTNTTSTGTGTATNVKGIILTELNIRKDATQNSDRVGGYKYGDRVTILETQK